MRKWSHRKCVKDNAGKKYTWIVRQGNSVTVESYFVLSSSKLFYSYLEYNLVYFE